MIVCKFGGSSTTTKDALFNIKKLTKKKSRRVFVFSALGKEDVYDRKITDLLINFCDTKNMQEKYKIIEKIKLKFYKLINLTHVNIDFSAVFDNILKTKNRNYIISRGEYLTAQILAQFLEVKFIPAEQVFWLKNGVIDFETTSYKAKRFLSKYGRFCTGGFYGFDIVTKDIALFERGGGDISGAILAKCLDAKTYENFTDVAGVKMANPRYVPDAKTIKKLSYKQMRCLAQCDGKVLHEKACELLDGLKTKTIIVDTFNLTASKTIIDSENHRTKFVCFKEDEKEVSVISYNNATTEEIRCTKDKLQDVVKEKYYDLIGGKR